MGDQYDITNYSGITNSGAVLATSVTQSLCPQE